MHIFTQSLFDEQDTTQGQYLSGVKLVWIQSSFSLMSCHTKAKEHSLPYYLLIAGGRIDNSTISKGIITKWNANSIVQDLN